MLKHLWLPLVLFLSSGCDTGPFQEGSMGEERPPESQISVLALGTHGVGSLVNAMGAGIATVLSERLPIEIKVVASSGPTEWLPMVATSEMDLGILNSWDAEMGRRGKSIYERLADGRGFPILLITSGHKALNGIVVAHDSDIKRWIRSVMLQ